MTNLKNKKYGETIYVLNSSQLSSGKLSIEERIFEGFVSDTTIEFSGKTSSEIESWAVAGSKDDATKFAITVLIKTKELNEPIQEMDFMKEYSKLEKNNSELILKYIDCVN